MEFGVDQAGALTCRALAQVSVTPDACFAVGGQTTIGSVAFIICGLALTAWAWRRFL